MIDVHLEVTDSVAWITLDHPPVNAIRQQTMDDMVEAFSSIHGRRDVRVAVLAAAGEKMFSAGADLKELYGSGEGEPRLSTMMDPGSDIRRLCDALQGCPVPLIGAVRGVAMGGGVAFLAFCDIIVAADDSSFSFPEINVGMLGGLAFLEHLVGRGRARYLYFTGGSISAQELLQIGAIAEVVPTSKVHDRARQLAADLAAKSPVAIRLAKEVMTRIAGHDMLDRYRTEQDYTNRLATFEDAEEAKRAFFERRAPVWQFR